MHIKVYVLQFIIVITKALEQDKPLDKHFRNYEAEHNKSKSQGKIAREKERVELEDSKLNDPYPIHGSALSRIWASRRHDGSK